MPVDYTFDGTIVVIAMRGEYSMEDIYKAAKESLADPNCPAHPRLLLDLTSSASISKRSSEDVNRVASFFGSMSKHFSDHIALVAPEDLKFGLMRMGSAGAEAQGVKSEVFRSLDDARKWLMS